MANTVNINHKEWDGQRGLLHYNLTYSDTAISGLNLLDISTLSPAPDAIKILRWEATLTGNFILSLAFDADTDQPFARLEGQAVDESFYDQRDFTDGPNGGWCPTHTAAGFVGDILATATGIASADDFDLVIVFEAAKGPTR